MDRYNAVSFVGLFVLMFIAWVFSADRRRVNWRALGWGTALQLVLGVLVFRVPAGRKLFLWINDLVCQVLEAAAAGQKFVFGPLAIPPGQTSESGQKSLGFILATQGFPTIIFFAALMGLLYYLGIMQAIIRAFAWVFSRLMRVSGAESLCAASNIFVGIESATTVRPYLQKMTSSELCTILTAGMATIASSVLGLYVIILKGRFPTIAGHLVSASLLSAPAALIMSKLLFPEAEEPETLGVHIRLEYERESGAIEAIINGAMAGVKLVVGIVALLIAFLGLVALIDMILGWVGYGAGTLTGRNIKLSLDVLLGYVFRPFAVIIGIPPVDATLAGNIIGERVVGTEVKSYMHMAQAIGAGMFKHGRTPVVLAYALCGFAHVASMAIFVGGIAALVPERRKDLARLGPRALVAATFACLMTGAVAGTFYYGGATILAK